MWLGKQAPVTENLTSMAAFDEWLSVQHGRAQSLCYCNYSDICISHDWLILICALVFTHRDMGHSAVPQLDVRWRAAHSLSCALWYLVCIDRVSSCHGVSRCSRNHSYGARPARSHWHNGFHNGSSLWVCRQQLASRRRVLRLRRSIWSRRLSLPVVNRVVRKRLRGSRCFCCSCARASTRIESGSRNVRILITIVKL